jgi:cytoskeletal protein CcmA (bactofilin family)
MGLALLGFGAPLFGAEVKGGSGQQDVYHLAASEVVHDDLYVAAGEIIIDGIVEGDLVAAGGYIEVNGEVTGDVLLAGAGVVINGKVGDDARVAGAGVTVAGAIGDDLFAAAGGPGWPGMPTFPIQINGRAIAQGVQLASSATVGGDAYLAGGQGLIDGQVAGDLYAGMRTIRFGGSVDHDARLYGSSVVVDPSAKVAGTLTYQSEQPAVIPAGVAASVVQEQPAQPVQSAPARNPAWDVLRWLWRTALLVIGFALLAWLVWQLAPGLLRTPANQIAARPVEAGLYGLIAAALLLPVIIALVILAAIFWGLPGALAASSFLLGAAGLLWILSPLFTGYWLGHLLADRGYALGELVALLVGTLTIVLVARLLALIPCLGVLLAGLIYLITFALALGGIIRARRRGAAANPQLITASPG